MVLFVSSFLVIWLRDQSAAVSCHSLKRCFRPLNEITGRPRLCEILSARKTNVRDRVSGERSKRAAAARIWPSPALFALMAPRPSRRVVFLLLLFCLEPKPSAWRMRAQRVYKREQQATSARKERNLI
jgi:hypothetical protein